MSTEGSPPSSPAQERLDEHLELLRAEDPGPGRSLAPRIVRTARWQRALRAPVQVAAAVVGAVIDALSGLMGGRRRGAR
jgi:hypothetical protein